MLHHLRNLFTSSPREKPSPSDSSPLPPRPVVIRRVLCQQPPPTPATTPISLSAQNLSSFLDTPPVTIACLLSSLDTPPIQSTESTSNFLNTPTNDIVQFISKTPANVNTHSTASPGSSLGPPSEIVEFDDCGRELLLACTPHIHPSSPTFFAAVSPVLFAPMAVKRNSPSVNDDLDFPRAPKRIKLPVQKGQTSSSVSSRRQSYSSRRSSNTTATEYNSSNSRTPVPPHAKRKRPKVEDDNDEDYSVTSDFGSASSLHTGPAKSHPPDTQPVSNSLSSPNNPHSTKSPNRRAKRPRRARSDSLYIDKEGSDEGEFEVPEATERDQLIYQLTREKARRLAEAVKVPEYSNMCEEERDLYLDLALRGCKPVMSFDWARDFSTLPESLFSVQGNHSRDEEEHLTFRTEKGTDFAARKAFQELLKIGGYVRDCRLLTVQPQKVIERAIRKYVRWAITDSGLRTTAATIPVHTTYTQRPGQTALSAVTRLARRMERLAERHQKVHGKRKDAYWPTLIGFLVCGPILTLVSLDTNPHSVAWTKKPESRVKYLGQFDMSEIDQDVWNSLAIAIAVIHMRQRMGRLASAYTGPLFPQFRGQSDDTEDEDF